MPDALHHPQPEFGGYVYFDDPDWWHEFTITKKCAQAIQEFRQAVIALRQGDGEELCTYEARVNQLWEASERVVNQVQWHAKRDIAVKLALGELYEECADLTAPVSFSTTFIRNNLKGKAASIHSVLSKDR